MAQSRLCATPLFLYFFNGFIGFVEYSMECGKKSTLCHTLKPVNIRGIGEFEKEKNDV